jgi:antitoxin YefM
MYTETYSNTRANLARIMDKVNDDHAPVLVTRQNGQPVVMMSLADYNAWQETDYLLRSPANAKWLMESIEQHRRGELVTPELDLDAD